MKEWQRDLADIVSGTWFDLKYRKRRLDILTETWDNLFILDGCRYDALKAFYPSTEKRYSKAPNTRRWLLTNFKDRDLSDVIYVTANPIYRTVNYEFKFKRIIDVWDTEWNSGIGSVRPERLLEKAKPYFDLKSRVIVHFVQPHQPFIGFDKTPDGNIWSHLRAGRISENEARTGYYSNLNLALKAIEATDIDNAILTADHGNSFGVPYLWGTLYGHPPFHIRDIIEVPWVEL